MKKFLVIVGLLFVINSNAQTTTSDVWINEFHYDARTLYGQPDASEFVELAIKNSIVTNASELAKYKIVLYTSGAYDNVAYNTGKGLPYNVSSSWYSDAETNHALSSFQQCPVAGTGFTLLYKTLPILQDVPAAIALVYNTTVIQLLSYEKSFKIAQGNFGGGVAAGMTTSLILKQNMFPAMETANQRENHSISLIGTGTSYNSFTWEDDSVLVTATPCAANTNTFSTQSFAVPLPVRWLSVNARGAKESINVQWQVATEEGVLNYTIEAALENNSYKEMALVPYSRSNNGNYNNTIFNLAAGTYKIRIKSRLQSGEVEYSETRIVKLTNGSVQFASVYPNPVRNGVANLQIIPASTQAYTIQVSDINGKLISSKSTLLQANTINSIQVPISKIKGMYQLKIIGKNDQHTIKVIIQ